MTTSRSAELARRRQPLIEARSPFGAIADVCREIADEAAHVTWPSPKYQKDPVGFFREILGVEPWSKQIEILEAARDHKRVSVSSGNKCGKTKTVAGLSLWFYASHAKARVVLTAPTDRQVNGLLWREVRMLFGASGTCVSCRAEAERANPERPLYPRPCPHSAILTGEIRELARSGLRASDFREITGHTAREAEAVAGISSPRLLYVVDEASGISQTIYDAIEGNRAGGASIILISNPTRCDGEFFRSQTDKAIRRGEGGESLGFYKAIRVSGEETPNAVEGREVIAGLASREWIDEKRIEWGEDHPLYAIRVRGEFALNEEGKILSIHEITESEARWRDLQKDGGGWKTEPGPKDGRLHLGVDPAGPGLGGDESAFIVRRGRIVLDVHTRRGLSDGAHVAEVLGLLAKHRHHREPAAVVKIDREGPIGNAVFGLLRAHVEMSPDAFELIGVRSSDKAVRQPAVYDRVRDELWANLANWITKESGCIPEDVKLAKELHIPDWTGQLNGKLKATPKSEFRKQLDGRSPDRADALALAVWEPVATRSEKPKSEEPDSYASSSSYSGTSAYGDRLFYGGGRNGR